MLHPTNGTTAPVLSYRVNDTPVRLYADGSLAVGQQHFDQATAFSLAIALRLPGIHPTITRLERLRQEAETLHEVERERQIVTNAQLDDDLAAGEGA